MRVVESIQIVTPARRGGRPSRQQAEGIRGQILDIAKELFFTRGYGSTSIDIIVTQAKISKRTFYVRFKDKAELFKEVVHHVVGKLRPPDITGLFEGKNSEEILLRLASLILCAAMTPDALALQRLVLSEASRFPELAQTVLAEGSRAEAIKGIASVLQGEVAAGRFAVKKPIFAAEQFLQMVMAYPQRRAFGIGKPMTTAELSTWARDSVALFLNGVRSLSV